VKFLSFNCISNQTEEKTKQESIKLFRGANNSIKILAGNINSPFYSDENVVDSLSDAAKRGVKVELAFFPIAGQGTKSKITKIQTLKLERLKNRPIRHVTIVDGKHLRIEAKHRDGSKTTPAIICKDDPPLASEWESAFESLVAAK